MISKTNYQVVDLTKFKNINTYVPEIKDNYMIDENGNVYSKVYNRLVKPYPDKDGYYRYLFAPNEYTPRGVRPKYKLIGIHTLVNKIFNGRPDESIYDPVTDHIDGNRQNNNYKNLRWINKITNSNYSTRHVNRNELLPDSDIPKIYEERKQGLTLAQIAGKHNCDFRYINHILYGNKRLQATLKAGLTPEKCNVITQDMVNSISMELLDSKIEYTKDTYQKIAKKYNIREEAIRFIVNRLCFTNWSKFFDFKNKTTNLFDNSPDIFISSKLTKIGDTSFRYE